MVDLALVSVFVAFALVLLGFWVVVVERLVMSLLGARASDEEARCALRLATVGAAVSAIGYGAHLLVVFADAHRGFSLPPVTQVGLTLAVLGPGLGLLAAWVRPSMGRWLVVGMIGVNVPLALSGLLVGGVYLLPGLGAAVAVLGGARGTRIGAPAI